MTPAPLQPVGPETAAPWQRQPRETGKAYEAFCVYRDMGVTRSVRAAAAQLSKARQTLVKWSTQWNWKQRVDAWDAHLNDEREKAWREAARVPADEIAEMNRRHALAAVALQRKALNALEQLVPGDLDARAVLQYLVEAAKLERLARGEATSRHQTEGVIEQEVVVQLLADPQGRLLATQLAEQLGAHANGHTANGQG